MSTISNFMLANLAERLTPLLQTPVEDIVYEILDRKGLPTRSEIRDLKNRLERIDEEVKKLNEQLEKLREAAAKPAAPVAKAKPAKKAAAKPAKKEKPKAADKPARRRGRPPRQGPPPICNVDGCDLPVRSKGFCAKHYQSWRRGRLQGFVDPNGMLPLDAKGTKVKVDKRYVALPASCRAEGDKLVIGVKGRELKRNPPAVKKQAKKKKKKK